MPSCATSFSVSPSTMPEQVGVRRHVLLLPDPEERPAWALGSALRPARTSTSCLPCVSQVTTAQPWAGTSETPNPTGSAFGGGVYDDCGAVGVRQAGSGLARVGLLVAAGQRHQHDRDQRDHGTPAPIGISSGGTESPSSPAAGGASTAGRPCRPTPKRSASPGLPNQTQHQNRTRAARPRAGSRTPGPGAPPPRPKATAVAPPRGPTATAGAGPGPARRSRPGPDRSADPGVTAGPLVALSAHWLLSTDFSIAVRVRLEVESLSLRPYTLDDREHPVVALDHGDEPDDRRGCRSGCSHA